MNKISRNLPVFASIVLLSITFTSQSQTSFIWAKQLGTEKEDYVRNHVEDRYANIYVSGNTKGIMDDKNFGKTDGFITKIDSSGNTKWSRQFGSAEDEDVQWSAIDNRGFVYITGTTTGVLNLRNFGKEDIFIAKYSSEGKKIWVKQFGSDSTDIALGIFADKKGYIYLTGATLGILGKSSSGNQDAFIMKFDDQGNHIFTNQFGTVAHDAGSAITGDNNGNIYVCGSTFGDLSTTNKGLMDGFTGHFSDKGVLLKFIQFGSTGFDIPTSILVDNDKNIYVGGTTTSNFAGQQLGEGDCFLMKLNSIGDILWNNQFGTKNHDGIKDMCYNPKITGNILISGLLNLPPPHAFLRLYKNDGSLVWEKNLIAAGDTKDASGKSVSINDEGYIYQIGLTASDLFGTLIGVTDFYVLKLKSDNPTLPH